MYMSERTPQTEDGYLRIANELYEAILQFNFSKRQLLVVLAIIRKTYGYGKKSDDVSLSQLEGLISIDRAHISRTINELVAMGVLLKQNGKYGQVLALIKNYRNWKVLPKQQQVECCQNSNVDVAETATEVLPKQQTQKTTPKDNTQKKDPPPPVSRKKQKTTMAQYLESCKELKVKPIPPEDKVFEYSKKTEIPIEWIYLCWREFVEKHIDTSKTYKDWPAAFRNCVRSNWYRLWYLDNGEPRLTTTGQMAEKYHRDRNRT